MFHKILIANRGEIALRIVRTCREMGIRSVVAHSQADAHSLPVRVADESICVGPNDPRASYLNIPVIISAAPVTDSEVIHPGYGSSPKTRPSRTFAVRAGSASSAPPCVPRRARASTGRLSRWPAP